MAALSIPGTWLLLLVGWGRSPHSAAKLAARDFALSWGIWSQLRDGGARQGTDGADRSKRARQNNLQAAWQDAGSDPLSLCSTLMAPKGMHCFKALKSGMFCIMESWQGYPRRLPTAVLTHNPNLPLGRCLLQPATVDCYNTAARTADDGPVGCSFHTVVGTGHC